MSGQRTVTRQRCAHAPAPRAEPHNAPLLSSRRHSVPARGRATLAAFTSAVSSGAVDLSGWSGPSGPTGAGGTPQSAPLNFQLNGSSVASARGRPRGIVHFLGGAFAGATPQLTVTYSRLTHPVLRCAAPSTGNENSTDNAFKVPVLARGGRGCSLACRQSGTTRGLISTCCYSTASSSGFWRRLATR